ncbi:hypothetical protein A9K55_005446 [Cordyceps militaris]|uniref:Nucleotide-binding, alpha-beta plait n=1 Tax=Cordyceps militaris TaxID=73501 RepID=A0A2H4S9M3_CORMI|nr:hypothetical protein A9K55_005446 [Cordyceps militaris]
MSSTPAENDTPSGDALDILSLNYHADIELVEDPKIFRGNNTGLSKMDSRRVIFYNLPPSVTALLVARAAAAFGQVLRVEAVAPLAPGLGTTVIVEFMTSNSATMCQLAINSTCPTFCSQDGQLYVAGVWVVPTPSFPIGRETNASVNRGCTRTVAMFPISKECVWFMIQAVAPQHDILDAEYSDAARRLTVEFARVDAAHRTLMQLNHGIFDFVFGDEACQREAIPREDSVEYGGYVPYVPPNYLHQRFERAPFNEYWPHRYYYVMTLRNLHPRRNYNKRATSSSDATATDDDSHDAASSTETSSYDEPRGRPPVQGHVSRYVRTVFPRFPALTRSLRSRRQKQEKKEPLASVDESQLAGSWDQYFENRHTISLRGWDEYGKIARHRRELCAKQALAEGIIPKCGGHCPLDCRDIKETPRPEEVDRFLAAPQEDLLIAL